jgi:hypothetical protein
MKEYIKKTVAILLAVLFVVSLTAVAVSAIPCKYPGPRCHYGEKAVCTNGHWKCIPTPIFKPCKLPAPLCPIGDAICIKGDWTCIYPPKPPKPPL